jgi:hypothetical protein
MTIMMVAMAALALVLTNAFAAVAVSRESQQATGLADAVLAQDEALPWTTIEDGLVSSDPTFSGDEGPSANLVAGSGGYCFEGLALVVGGSVPTGCPAAGAWYNLPALGLCQSSVQPNGSFPVTSSGGDYYLTHQECVKRNGTSFEIGVYPTQVAGVPIQDEVEVAIVVSWGTATSQGGADTHITDSAILACGTTDGLPLGACL